MEYCIAILLPLSGIALFLFIRRRRPCDVIADLQEDPTPRDGSERPVRLHRGGTGASSSRDVGICLLGALSSGAFAVLVISPLPGTFIPAFLIGGALSALELTRRKKKKAQKASRQIDFFLPIVMERLVMAVQAGLDIYSAISAAKEYRLLASGVDTDPVTDLLSEAISQTENGLSLEEALQNAAKRFPNTGLHHAFLHLALAHKEGGELVYPLRELSDATQLYYQESIEEYIAGLPVKATVPLLLTFVALIIFFITPPMLQVFKMTDRALSNEEAHAKR